MSDVPTWSPDAHLPPTLTYDPPHPPTWRPPPPGPAAAPPGVHPATGAAWAEPGWPAQGWAGPGPAPSGRPPDLLVLPLFRAGEAVYATRPLPTVLTIGRRRECDVWVPSPLVSRVHAVLFEAGGALQVLVVGRGGVAVDRRPVHHQSSIAMGSLLQLGDGGPFIRVMTPPVLPRPLKEPPR